MSQVRWSIEYKGQTREVVTEDKDGHTAHKAWQKGSPFFRGEPAFASCRVTRVAASAPAMGLVEDIAERSRKAFAALRQPGESETDNDWLGE